MSDCDMILNFARPTPGRPVDARAANEALIANMARCSAPGARLVYFSSMSAYREFRPMNEPAVITSYAWEKRGIEKVMRREASRNGKPAWNLRIAQVMGELQTISSQLRHAIRSGPVVVPWAGEYPSTVVYAATIAEAVLGIAAGREPAGAYDLICPPEWTWRLALEHEAACCGAELRIEESVPELRPVDGRAFGAWPARVRALASGLLGSPRVRELGLIALNYFSAETNLRAQSEHFQRRAKAEIDRYFERPPSAEAFLLAQPGTRYLRSLRPTAELLSDPAFRLTEPKATGTFASDLPSAV
jgi:hypothetical protein